MYLKRSLDQGVKVKHLFVVHCNNMTIFETEKINFRRLFVISVKQTLHFCLKRRAFFRQARSTLELTIDFRYARSSCWPTLWRMLMASIVGHVGPTWNTGVYAQLVCIGMMAHKVTQNRRIKGLWPNYWPPRPLLAAHFVCYELKQWSSLSCFGVLTTYTIISITILCTFSRSCDILWINKLQQRFDIHFNT